MGEADGVGWVKVAATGELGVWSGWVGGVVWWGALAGLPGLLGVSEVSSWSEMMR